MNEPSFNDTELMMSYFKQLTDGCDLIVCKNPFCAHCKQFKFRGQEDLWSIAQDLAANHNSTPRLCKTIRNVITDESKQNLLNEITIFAKTEMNDTQKAESLLTSIFSKHYIFANLLNSNNLPLSISNSRIDDQLLYEFSDKLSKIPKLDNAILQFVSDYAKKVLASKHFFNHYSKLRTLLIIFYFPIIISPDIRPPILIPLIKQIANSLKGLNYQIFVSWLSELSLLRKQFLGFLHTAINTNFAEHPKESLHSETYHFIFKVMSFIYAANLNSNTPLPIQNFYDANVNKMLNIEDEINLYKRLNLHGKFASILKKYPFVLTLLTKAQVTKSEAKEQMILMAQHSMEHSTKAFYTTEQFFIITVSRANIVKDAYSQLSKQNKDVFLKKLKVQFKGEQGVDAGGVSRDFIYTVTLKMLEPKIKLFKIINNRYYWPTGKASPKWYKLFGMIVGLAIHNSILLPIRFPLAIYKRLLSPDKPLLIKDLDEIDRATTKSLMQLLEMVKNQEDISVADLSFSINTGLFDSSNPHDVPLDPNIPMTHDVVNSNFELYVEKYLNYRLVERVKESFDAFREGFETTCVASTYKLLEPEELDILVSGVDMYDWDEFRNNCRIDEKIANSKYIKWFWELFESFSKNEKMLFLKYVTGTDRAPIGGLSSLRVTIRLTSRLELLPISHTCFNTFDLPKYPSKEVMNEKLKLAFKYTEDGFGLK